MKEKFAAAGLEISAFLIIFFTPLLASLMAIGFLIFTDTFTGVWAAKKGNNWDVITSRKGGRIISKLILYPLCIIVAKVMEDYLAPEIPFVKVVSGTLALVEGKSIYENISIILGYDLWKRIRAAIWKQKE